MEAGSGATRSRELLRVSGGDLQDKLLINSKLCKKKSTSSPIVAVPRSSILDRVQNFLPQMAQANETLTREMAIAPANYFDIENTDDAPSNIIEMNVAVVELSGSDTSEAESSSGESESQSDDDNWVNGEVTENNIKLPKQNGKKATIEMLDSKNV